MLDTIISLASLAKSVYDTISDIRRGNPMQPVIKELQKLHMSVERLSDRIYYAPNFQTVKDTSRNTQRTLTDLREVRQYLEPVQQAMGGDILSSAMIPTPELMRHLMRENPWKMLVDIRPVSLVTPHSNPDMVPIQFEYGSSSYIGWQLRGTLPLLFNCAYDPELHVLKPTVRPPVIDFDWVTIPAGEFLYGEKKERVYLDTFRVMRTPVTNAQYKVFVDSATHKPPSYWKGDLPPAGKERHPVVNVSWYDAQALCAWVGARLPTVKEWEKAARGTDGRDYPWGNEEPDARRANFWNPVGGTSEVGRYPAGASPYGVLDMAGNVWEWCEERELMSGHRSVRGGSWVSDSAQLRADYRGLLTPVSGNYRLGVRLVLAP